MGAFSYYLANKIGDHVLRGVTYTAPANVYVALFTSNPGKDGSGTEVDGESYERQLATFSQSVDGELANDDDIFFAVATEPWGTVTHFALYDAQTEGNLLYFAPFDEPDTYKTGNQAIFRAGALTVIHD